LQLATLIKDREQLDVDDAIGILVDPTDEDIARVHAENPSLAAS
jgi:hypothetical protein